MENTQSRNGNVGQCEPCDQCYNLVQQAANNHRDDLKELAKLLQNIAGVISIWKPFIFSKHLQRIPNLLVRILSRISNIWS